MKYLFYSLLFITFVSCEKPSIRKVSVTPEKPGSTKPKGEINTKFFDLINLDYPGLENAKTLFEAGKTYESAKAVLDYYRLRTNVVNPTISLISVNATEDDRLKANFALDNNRFFVNNYYEDATKKMPYSLGTGNNINWKFEPSGADNEYQKQLHRHQWFVPQARVYRATRDEKYVESWIGVYKDWLEKNPMPISGTNTTTWWQLQVAERVNDQTKLFDYYKHSINFTPEWMTEFMVNFAQHNDFLIKYPYPDGNILISQGGALVSAGVLFPEFKKAVEWRNSGFQILDSEVKKQFLSDGMHFELDLSYHIAAIADFYEITQLIKANAQIAGNAGIDFGQYLHQAAKVVMNFTYPNYFTTSPSDSQFVPGFNDTRQNSWSRSVLNKNFVRYNEMFPEDRELLYMASYGKAGTVPSIAPQAFTKSGYYMMRNGWDKLSTLLILSNNYTDGSMPVWSHNQPDNGTFELYHKGRNFFPDAGVFAYSGTDNTDREWYRQTKVHNTMTLNSKNITTGKGKSLKVVSNGATEVVAIENPGYSNLKHRRYVFFVDKKFFVLVDEGIGSATGTVNLNFNFLQGDTEVNLLADKNGAFTSFADGNNIAVKSFGSDNMTTVPFNGKVSYAPGVEFNRKAYAVNMVKSAGQTVRYITVIYPTSQPSTISMDATFTQPFAESGVSVEVIINGTKHNLNCNL